MRGYLWPRYLKKRDYNLIILAVSDIVNALFGKAEVNISISWIPTVDLY